ncbi:MAG: hypothetical protein AAF657_19300 [Acidobacteriota bacterium]
MELTTQVTRKWNIQNIEMVLCKWLIYISLIIPWVTIRDLQVSLPVSDQCGSRICRINEYPQDNIMECVGRNFPYQEVHDYTPDTIDKRRNLRTARRLAQAEANSIGWQGAALQVGRPASETSNILTSNSRSVDLDGKVIVICQHGVEELFRYRR